MSILIWFSWLNGQRGGWMAGAERKQNMRRKREGMMNGWRWWVKGVLDGVVQGLRQIVFLWFAKQQSVMWVSSQPGGWKDQRLIIIIITHTHTHRHTNTHKTSLELVKSVFFSFFDVTKQFPPDTSCTWGKKALQALQAFFQKFLHNMCLKLWKGLFKKNTIYDVVLNVTK